MLGAIIGDIAGSVYEVEEMKRTKNKEKISYEQRIKVLDKQTPLFREGSSYTDDSVLTCAIADALLNGAYFSYEFEKYLKEYGLNEISLGKDVYGRNRFGQGFTNWLLGSNFTNSYGNGCAMRICAVPMLYDSLNQVEIISHNATYPTHNHEDSLNAVDAVCLAIYYAKQKKNKDFIKKEIERKCGYDLNFDLEDLQKNYKFDVKAKGSVPQAIFCFLKSEDFEDAIRIALSIGGDSDTIASITGAISEAYYGIPKEIKEEVKSYIPDYMNNVLENFYSIINQNKENKNQKKDYNNNNYKRRVKSNNGRKY